MKVCGARFSGLVRLEDQADGRTAKLLEPLSYTTKGGWVINVPAGFVTDYASIPRFMWRVIPPRGRYNRAAIVHDWLYQRAPGGITWSRADALMREMCEDLCTNKFQTWAIWSGLRVGGWITWKRYRNG